MAMIWDFRDNLRNLMLAAKESLGNAIKYLRANKLQLRIYWNE